MSTMYYLDADGVKPKRPKKTALLIADQLVELIRLEDLQPGDRLPSESLMLEQYQVSRGTMREALRYLEFQGVIMLKPGSGGGPIVQHPDADILVSTLTLLLQFQKTSFSEIIDARRQMEPLVVRLAASNRSDDDMEALWRNVTEAEDLTIGPDRFHQLADEYHALVAQASGNAIFRNLMAALAGTLTGVNQGIDYPRKHRAASNQIHKDIIEAIENQDADRAEELMRVHLDAHSAFTNKRFPRQINQTIKWIS